MVQTDRSFSIPRASATLSSRSDVVAGCFSSLSSDPLVMTAMGAFQGEARGLFHSTNPSSLAAASATVARLAARRISLRTAALAQGSFFREVSMAKIFARRSLSTPLNNVSER